MPSPFPGMDPFLEGAWWSTFRNDLVIETRRHLPQQVKPEYCPLIGGFQVKTLDSSLRFLPVSEDDDESDEDDADQSRKDESQPVYLNLARPHWVGLSFIGIKKLGDYKNKLTRRKNKTIVVFLDPVVKKAPGRSYYLRWREKVFNSTTCLVEIDLLRQGRRPPMLDPYPDAPCYAMVSRHEFRPCCEVWPIHLDRPLPKIPIPIPGDDREVVLDLQTVFTRAYDLGSFDRVIEYDKPPDVHLDERHLPWLKRMLKDA
jgi:hypothetical protein